MSRSAALKQLADLTRADTPRLLPLRKVGDTVLVRYKEVSSRGPPWPLTKAELMLQTLHPAKIVRVRKPPAKGGSRQAVSNVRPQRMLVHYKGFSKRHDEWVYANLVLCDTPQHRQLMAALLHTDDDSEDSDEDGSVRSEE